MYKDKYVFAQLVSFLDRNCFNYLVRKYGADKYVKFFSCWNQLLTLIFTLVRDKGLLRIVPIVLEGASGALSISVSTRALATTPSKRTLKKWNCVGGLNYRMKLERRFSKALLCLSIFRKLCSCSAVGDTVFSPPFSSVPERALRFSSLESFIKRAS